MAKSEVKTCTCKHPFQDETYGRGNRVHNPMFNSKTGKARGYRCTVCSKEKTEGVG